MTLEAERGARTVGLRQRKKASTRQALLDAALRLFDEKGFAGTSVDEIAAAADVSRSTFFRYFGSKESVLFGASDEAGQLFIDLLEARPSTEGHFQAFEGALVQLAEARGNQWQGGIASPERAIPTGPIAAIAVGDGDRSLGVGHRRNAGKARRPFRPVYRGSDGHPYLHRGRGGGRSCLARDRRGDPGCGIRSRGLRAAREIVSGRRA